MDTLYNPAKFLSHSVIISDFKVGVFLPPPPPSNVHEKAQPI